MRTFVIAALLCGCGSTPPPKTEQHAQDLAACQKNLAAINARIRQLMEEKLKVNDNRARLPEGYDTASIDQTEEQIESELTMRRESAQKMQARCDTIDQKLHDAQMKQPL